MPALAAWRYSLPFGLAATFGPDLAVAASLREWLAESSAAFHHEAACLPTSQTMWALILPARCSLLGDIPSSGSSLAEPCTTLLPIGCVSSLLRLMRPTLRPFLLPLIPPPPLAALALAKGKHLKRKWRTLARVTRSCSGQRVLREGPCACQVLANTRFGFPPALHYPMGQRVLAAPATTSHTWMDKSAPATFPGTFRRQAHGSPCVYRRLC